MGSRKKGRIAISTDLPAHLKAEQAAVEAQIRAAFAGVTREDGFSWTQAEVIDRYGDDQAMRDALAGDTEQSWEELVDNPSWDDTGGVGGFCFLDPIGYRYYLAPAMIRHVRGTSGSSLQHNLTIHDKHQRRHVSLLTPPQCEAVARFIRFKIARDQWTIDQINAVCGAGEPDDWSFLTSDWQEAYDSHWKRFDTASG